MLLRLAAVLSQRWLLITPSWPLLFHPLFHSVSCSDSGISSNEIDTSSAFHLLLQQCSNSLQAKQIHAQLLVSSNSHHLSSFLSARLISIYSRFSLLPDARSVFNSAVATDHRYSLLWNSILRACLSHGRPKEALSHYIRMRALGALPDGFTFPLAIRACSALRDPKLSSSVHNHAVSMGFEFHLYVANELIVMYGNLGMLEGARKMESVGPEPNSVTWTAVLSAHARCQRHTEVLSLFKEMRHRGVKSTSEAVAVALSACPYTCGLALPTGKAIHGFAIGCGFDGYSFVGNSLICMYGKLGNKMDAELLFWGLEVRDLISWNALISSYAARGLCNEAYEVFAFMGKTGEASPNVVSWSAVISGFASNGKLEQSLDLFRQMQSAGVEANTVTVATVLSTCAALSALHLGKEVHAHLIRCLMNLNLMVENGLVNMYNKSGSLRYGRCVFDQTEDKDQISWNSMIAGYGMHGHCDEAIATLEEMVRTGCEPDGVTFVAILSACSHAGRISEGRKLFDKMVNEYGILPGMEHYSCMVDLLGRAGLLKEASELIERMPTNPNTCVLGSLLNSCRIHGNSVVAEDTIAEALGLETEATGNYMLLSHIYAASGRWKDSARVRMMTKLKGLKKNPGKSWIEMKNKVHVFSAGSILSYGAENVYYFLEDLYQQMESEKFDLPSLPNAVI